MLLVPKNGDSERDNCLQGDRGLYGIAKALCFPENMKFLSLHLLGQSLESQQVCGLKAAW